ncbi:hypothetical protein GCM10009111_02980 [Colwellia asteriadis]|uniref:Secreted protein n=1 Tax=Colwellia asteriadis TaxID=517723 RepID=A0ABP3WC06_9GAMM
MAVQLSYFVKIATLLRYLVVDLSALILVRNDISAKGDGSRQLYSELYGTPYGKKSSWLGSFSTVRVMRVFKLVIKSLSCSSDKVSAKA